MGDNHITNASKYSPSLVVAFRIAAAFGQPLDAVFQYQAEGVDPVL
jgi:DNA-binding XRE family transcriptional regulator